MVKVPPLVTLQRWARDAGVELRDLSADQLLAAIEATRLSPDEVVRTVAGLRTTGYEDPAGARRELPAPHAAAVPQHSDAELFGLRAETKPAEWLKHLDREPLGTDLISLGKRKLEYHQGAVIARLEGGNLLVLGRTGALGGVKVVIASPAESDPKSYLHRKPEAGDLVGHSIESLRAALSRLRERLASDSPDVTRVGVYRAIFS